jgi:hypothetical protein
MRSSLALFVALTACGARSELATPDAEAPPTDVRTSDAVAAPDAPRVVFNLFDGTGATPVYEIRADGTGLRALTLPGARAVYPTFTADGRYLVYVSLAANETDASIVALDLRTRLPRTVLRGTRLGALAVSPDLRTVAYAQDLDLRAVGWDGLNDRPLVRGPNNLGCCMWGYGHPAFGTDPSTVYFSTAGRVERIGVDGTRRQQVIPANFRRIIFPNVGVSPDRTRLALGVACADGRALRVYDIAALPAPCEAGRELTSIEPSTVGNLSNNPAWGESGEIVYQQSNDLFVVDARGGTPRNLTAALTGGAGSNVSAANPTWVPRGVALP